MGTFLLPSVVYEFFSSVLRLTLEVVPVILTLERSAQISDHRAAAAAAAAAAAGRRYEQRLRSPVMRVG